MPANGKKVKPKLKNKQVACNAANNKMTGQKIKAKGGTPSTGKKVVVSRKGKVTTVGDAKGYVNPALEEGKKKEEDQAGSKRTPRGWLFFQFSGESKC